MNGDCKAKVTVSDPFQQTFIGKTKTFNYRIANAAESIQKVSGLAVNKLGGLLQDARRQLGGVQALAEHINPWLNQTGYARMFQALSDELHS